MKTKSIKTMLFLLMALSFMHSGPSYALSKGALTSEKLDYFYNTFTPILIKAHICNEVHKDCARNQYFICNSEETLSCRIYGITDEKVIKELFLSVLNSGLKVSNFEFMRSRYHEDSIFEQPLLEFHDRTGDELRNK